MKPSYIVGAVAATILFGVYVFALDKLRIRADFLPRLEKESPSSQTQPDTDEEQNEDNQSEKDAQPDTNDQSEK